MFVLAVRAATNWNDVKNVYGGIAAQVERAYAGGQTTLESEYPPLASGIFFLLKENHLGLSFPVAWEIFLFLAILACSIYVWKEYGMSEAAVFPAAIALTSLIFGLELVWGRYDVLVALLFYLTWRSHRKNHDARAGAFLAIAGCVKLVPFAAVPLLFIATPFRKWLRTGLGFVAGLVVSTAVPLVGLGWHLFRSNLYYLRYYHTNRGVQVESLWSGITMLERQLRFGWASRFVFYAGSYENTNVPRNIILVSVAFTCLALLAVLFFAWQKSQKGKRDFGLPLILTLLFLIGLGTVFSPQYLIWVIPLIFVWLWDERTVDWLHLAILVVTCAIASMTRWIYPLHYQEFLDQRHLSMTLLLNVRNVSVFALSGLLVWAWLMNSRASGRT